MLNAVSNAAEDETLLKEELLELVTGLRDGFQNIFFEEFSGILKRALKGSATETYLSDSWEKFHADPFAYCSSTNPASYGAEILFLALSKSGKV